MAPDSSAATNEKNLQAAFEALGDGPRANEPLLVKLRETLGSYQSAYDSSLTDSLDERFFVDMQQPLPGFDSGHAKAYAASDANEPSRMLYAHVCDWGKTQRYRLIEKLKGFEHQSLTQLIACGNVRISTTREERFVLFYERPGGIKLSELLRRKKIPANTVFLYEHILSPLASALQQLADMELSHGLVNCDNIYINQEAMLGPCVSEPCGLSQPFRYEPVERMQAMPYGKGEGDRSHDFYALGVVLLEVLHGPDHLAAYTRESLIQAILRQGAYQALMLEKEVPEVFYDFFRGVFSLNPDDRWTGRQVLAWLDGKRFNVLVPPMPQDATRPYDLSETAHANTRRELAHLFSQDWERMIASLHNNQLAHWVSVSLRNKELSDIITRLSRTAYDLNTRNETQAYEALMNIIILLDPYGPVRIRQLSMHIDGMDATCADLYMRKAHQELQLLAKFIEANMMNYWMEMQSKLHKDNKEYKVSGTINALNIRLDRLRGYIRNQGACFGIERMLYDLNPDMPCMSPALAACNVRTIQDLLIKLDQVASKLPENEDPIDRHISAFIASKLLIVKEIRLDELEGIPELARSKTIMAIYLLGSCQIKSPMLRLPGLTSWLVLRTLPLMDHIHSTTIRKKYKIALMQLASLGSIPKLAELVVSADYAALDSQGYRKAQQSYSYNARMISHYETADNIEAESAAMGFRIAKMVAYLCLMGALYFTIKTR